LHAEENKTGIIDELRFRRENPLCSQRRGAKALTNTRRLKRKVDLKKCLTLNQKYNINKAMNRKPGFKSGRGGKRRGAGRPKGTTIPPEKRRKPFGVRLPLWLIEWVRSQDTPSGRLIERALIQTYGLKKPKE
jgi:hypothetical protein